MDNIDIFRRIIERGFNQGDLTVADEVCSPSLLEHQYPVPNDLLGAEILKSQIVSARSQLNNLTLTIEDYICDGEKLWVRMQGTGVEHRSGQLVRIGVMDVCRFADGKLVEHWGIPDRFAILHQCGALTPHRSG